MQYPYRKLVLCSESRHPFYGSASRGRGGGHFPAYHCDNRRRGHYKRIPVKKFHGSVADFLQVVRIKDEYVNKIQLSFSERQEMKIENSLGQTEYIKKRILQIDRETSLMIQKIKFLHSEVTLQALEEEVEKLKKEKDSLLNEQAELDLQANNDALIHTEVIKKKSNRLPEAIINDHSEITKKQLFSLLFSELPTYEDLINRTATLKEGFYYVK